jgi:hypothetical protein
LAKPALIGWAARTVAEAAADYYADQLRLYTTTGKWPQRAAAVDALKGAHNRDRDGKGARGTDVHAAVHEVVTYGELLDSREWERETLAYVDQYRDFEDAYRPTYLYAETTCYSDEYGYAGTLDLIADLPGYGLTVMDYKTGGIYPEAALQLAAYRHSEYVITGPPWEQHPTPRTVGAAVLQLQPDRYSLVGVDTSEAVFTAFCHVVRFAEFRATCWDNMVGDIITPSLPNE